MMDTSEEAPQGYDWRTVDWAEAEHVRLSTVAIAMRILDRLNQLSAIQNDVFHSFLGTRNQLLWATSVSAKLHEKAQEAVVTLHDWALTQKTRAAAAHKLARAVFGSEHPDPQWWTTMTGADMAYAIGYSHPAVPMKSAPAVLQCNRQWVYHLRQHKNLEMTASGFQAYITASTEWQDKARALENTPLGTPA